MAVIGEFPNIRFGGIPLLATAPVSWEIREGVAPVARDFHFDVNTEPALRIRQGSPQTLTIEAVGETITIQNLWLLSIQPGPNPEIVIGRISDRRWMWPYGHVLKRYNMRRNVGVRRPDAPNDDILTEVAPEVQYWEWSLNEGVKWEAQDIMEDFLENELFRGEQSMLGGDFAPFAFDNRLGAHIGPLPVEDLELDDAADSAMSRLLDYFPGAGIFVTLAGTTVVYDRTSGQEAGLLGPRFAIADTGRIGFVPRVVTRPRSVRCLFTIECELRFDYREETRRTGDTLTQLNPERREAGRLMENVLPLPDHSATIFSEEFPGGETVHQGTYVEIGDALSSWGRAVGDDRFPPTGGRSVTLTDMRKAALPFVDLAAAIIPPAAANPGLHLSRVAALLENYRRTFRLPERWMDRILSLRPYRVATIDPASGQRAPAIVYCDYALMRSSPLVLDGVGEPDLDRAHYAMNVEGYPRAKNGGDVLDATFGLHSINAKAQTPGRVTVLDQDQGILQIDFVTGPMRYYNHVIPGLIDDGTNVTAKVDLLGVSPEGKPLFFNARSGTSGKLPELEPDWKAAVILTAVPASPNDTRQLFALEVSHDDPGLRELLPAHARALRGFGPTLDVRIPPGLETARVAWEDGSAATIMSEIFGYDSPTVRPAPKGSDIANLIVNLRQLPSEFGGLTLTRNNELESIALAEAARIYHEYADSFQGHSSYDFRDAPLTIRGRLESLVIEVAPSGEATVSVSLPPEQPRLSMYAFLDSGTRAFLMRLAQHPKAAI